MTVIDLGSMDQAFAQGGNRLCFVDPRDHHRCIKVLRPDRSPDVRRAQKKFPKNLRPLSRFDDNREEFRVYRLIDRTIGESAYALVSRCYGFVDTNFGAGLCSEMITDDSGLISISLKQYLWENGITNELSEKIKSFAERWRTLGMPSRDLLLHNIVVQQSDKVIERLVVIDGLGWAGLAPMAYWVPALARHKAARKVESLYRAIDQLLLKQSNRQNYGYHGWLAEEKRKTR